MFFYIIVRYISHRLTKLFVCVCVCVCALCYLKKVGLGQEHHTLLDVNILSLDLYCELEVGMD